MRRISILYSSALAILLVMPLPAYASGAQFKAIFISLLNTFRPLWITVAVLMLVIAGLTLVWATQEGAMEKGRQSILAVVIGGMIIMISPALLLALFTNQNPGGTAVVDTTGAITAEALGIVGWLSAMAAIFGLLFIFIAAVSAVVSFGQDEESYKKVRNALLHVILGLIIIATASIIQNALLGGTPNPLVGIIVSKILIVLGFMVVLAVGILIYAGFRMVANFGNEEAFNSGKSLAIRVVFGLVVVTLAYVATITVANIF